VLTITGSTISTSTIPTSRMSGLSIFGLKSTVGSHAYNNQYKPIKALKVRKLQHFNYQSSSKRNF
jgi:hypothetical protein